MRFIFSMIVLFSLIGLSAPDVRAQGTIEPIDPEADKILREMSDYLAKQESFSFEAEVLFETVFGGDDGDWGRSAEKISSVKIVKSIVRRPDRFAVAINDPTGNKSITFDGSTIVLNDSSANAYVKKDLSGTIDDALFLLRESYQSHPPLSDLMESNLYEAHMDGVVAASYLGATTLRGQDVHHLAFASDGLDWQVWIADGARPVPLLLQIVNRDEAFWPTYQAWFTDWDIGQAVSEDMFTFVEPEDAIETQFVEDADFE